MPETELPCPQCATLLAETATFCVACGAVLEPSWNKTRALPAVEKAPAPAAPPAVAEPPVAPSVSSAPSPAPKPSPAPRAAPPRPAPRSTVPPGSRVPPAVARRVPGAPGPADASPRARIMDVLAPLAAGILALGTFAGGVHYLASTRRHERVATPEGTPALSPPSPLSSALPSPGETPAPGPSPSPRSTAASPSPSPAAPASPSPSPEPTPAPEIAATTSVTPLAAKPEPSPPPEPAPAPPEPAPEPEPSPSPAIDDARVWDGHVWRPTERGHKHGPHCGHSQVSGRWSLFANEPREYDGDLEDFQKKTPENGLYDFRGKTYWLPDHVHSDHCIHKLGAYGWYLPEPETTPAPAPSPSPAGR